VARVFIETSFICTGAGPWTSDPLEPDGPISFAAGDAKLTFDLYAFDGSSFTQVLQDQTQIVPLVE
jgi:hypothetical protein